MNEKPMGINARVAKALQDARGRPMTMGEIMELAEIVKTSASEVSSALHKMQRKGLVGVVRGVRSANGGPRLVRKYIWVADIPAAATVQVVQTVAVSPLQMLGIGRIR